MKKLLVLVPAFVALAHCNLLKKAGDSAADGGVTTTAASSGSAQAAAPTLMDKALSFLSGGPFQGSMTMTITAAGKPPQTMVYMIKGTKMRFNTPISDRNGGGYVIVDTTGNKMTTVMDAKKMAMVVDMASPMGGQINATADAKKPVSFDRTGKTDTVAGYACDVVTIVEANGDKGEACIAKGITYPKMGATGGWMSALNDSFPLRSVIHDPAGAEKLRMEVTKIDKTPIDDSQFEVPAGYKTTSMEDMMKGMGGMRPPH